jgi:uncharacterized protein with HEPN domain
MQHDDLPYLGHMLDTARQARSKVEGIDRATFDADENLRLALAYLVQIIGEAARQVSDEGKAAHPEVPWREITGMRHRIVHDYMNVNFDVVWSVVTDDLPDLIVVLEPLVSPPEE